MKFRFLSGSARRRTAACLLLVLVSSFMGGAAAQAVRWEDYRGQSGTSGLAGVPYTGRAGAPQFNHTVATGVVPLRIIASNPANAVRTGTSANIDFRNVIDGNGLCDNRSAAGRATAACTNHAMGKVIYSRIRFPAAGTYTLAVAHDDANEVNLSSDYANPAYRDVTYDIPVGLLSSFTNGEDIFQTIGSFNAPQANSCLLVRMYWVNAGGQNFSRLRWQHPQVNGGVAQVIPAAQFSDPGVVPSESACQGSVVSQAASILLEKNVLGRVAPQDQFTVSINQGATALRSATTTGSDLGVQASTGALQVTPGAYILRDAMAAGSVGAMGDYLKTISCTARSQEGNGQTVTPAGAGPDWTLTVANGIQYTCVISNQPRPTLTASKISVGAVGTFNFTGTNGITPDAITTTTANQLFRGRPQVLATAAVSTTLTEAAAPGFVLSGIQCSGLPAGVAATVDLPGRSVTLPAAATVNGAAIECTFTNTAGADLSISKSNGTDGVVSGTNTIYTITARNAGPGAADGAVLREVVPAGLSNCVVTECTPTGGASCPANNADVLASTGAALSSFPANSQVELKVQCLVQ
jgi:uncharacterized repeat protein (TIGR01451 family)